MEGIGVDFAVHRDRLDTELLCCANDAACDFAPRCWLAHMNKRTLHSSTCSRSRSCRNEASELTVTNLDINPYMVVAPSGRVWALLTVHGSSQPSARGRYSLTNRASTLENISCGTRSCPIRCSSHHGGPEGSDIGESQGTRLDGYAVERVCCGAVCRYHSDPTRLR